MSSPPLPTIADIIEQWECLHCETLHPTEDEADYCCAPHVSQRFVCPICDERFSYIERAQKHFAACLEDAIKYEENK